MELRLYARIIWKRAWIAVVLVVVALMTYVVARPTPTSSYVATMRLVVGLRPEETSADIYRYDRYYTWLTAEYLLDDLSEVVKSGAFAQDVAVASGVPVPPGAIQGATSAGKLHRILSVSIIWGDRAQLEQLAQAVVTVLQTQSGRYFAQLGAEQAVVSVIDPPNIAAIGPSLRQRLDLPLRLALALVAGIGLAFLLDYVDPSVRGRGDLQTFDMAILGEIPRYGGLLGSLRRGRER